MPEPQVERPNIFASNSHKMESKEQPQPSEFSQLVNTPSDAFGGLMPRAGENRSWLLEIGISTRRNHERYRRGAI